MHDMDESLAHGREATEVMLAIMRALESVVEKNEDTGKSEYMLEPEELFKIYPIIARHLHCQDCLLKMLKASLLKLGGEVLLTPEDGIEASTYEMEQTEKRSRGRQQHMRLSLRAIEASAMAT